MNYYTEDYLSHHGVLGMKWGVRKEYHNKMIETEINSKKESAQKKADSLSKKYNVKSKIASAKGNKTKSEKMSNKSKYYSTNSAVTNIAKTKAINSKIGHHVLGTAVRTTALAAINNNYKHVAGTTGDQSHSIFNDAVKLIYSDSDPSIKVQQLSHIEDAAMVRGASMLAGYGLIAGQVAGAVKTGHDIYKIAKS